MRGQGRVFRPRYSGIESKVWWLDYSVRGKRHRESSETTSKTAAQRLLRERIGNRDVLERFGFHLRLRLPRAIADAIDRKPRRGPIDPGRDAANLVLVQARLPQPDGGADEQGAGCAAAHQLRDLDLAAGGPAQLAAAAPRGGADA